jgi:hypothetical protein
MAEMTIRLIPDPETGKKNIIISLRSDADAMPHEHEQQHRALVDKLVEGGLLKAGEAGKVVVDRLEDQKEPATPTGNAPQQQRQSIGQGGS